MSFSDKEIVCEECSQAFIFTAGEQEFFSSKGLQNLPRRCNVCRQKRKLSTGSNEENFSYGRAVSYSGKTPRRLHIAPCSGSKSLSPECQEYTEVPFMPRGDRPIYCSSCYNVMKNAEAEAEAEEKIETSVSSMLRHKDTLYL